MKRNRKLIVPTGGADSTDRVRSWNEIALNANALDHTPVAPGEKRFFREHFGPGRTSRLAIVHIAIFDAVNAIARGYQSYTGLTRADRQAEAVECCRALAALGACERGDG